MGLQGHSDADVLIHAILDGILGAAGMGDIGKLFPDDNSDFKDIDSRKLLVDVVSQIKEKINCQSNRFYCYSSKTKVN